MDKVKKAAEEYANNRPSRTRSVSRDGFIQGANWQSSNQDGGQTEKWYCYDDGMGIGRCSRQCSNCSKVIMPKSLNP